MRDTRLTIEAKAIYAYMSSFAGAGLNSFPSVKLQLSELCISEKRYYKHRKLLEDLGYITIKQTRTKLESGKVVNDKNIYTLEQFPTPKPKEEIQKDKIKTNNKNNISENSQNDSSQNDSVQNVGSNSISINSNNINNNNTISSSSKEVDEEDKKQIIQLLQICQNNKFKLKKNDIKDLLTIYDFNKIAKAILTASATDTKIKNFKGYILATLNDISKIKKVEFNINNKKTSPHANFTQRDQDYKKLEKQLLGWTE